MCKIHKFPYIDCIFCTYLCISTRAITQGRIDMPLYVVTCPDFRTLHGAKPCTPVTTAKTAEMRARQGVASTMQGAYIDFRTLHGATEKGCRFAPNAEASPMGFYFP